MPKLSRQVTITNQRGLHARAAARFVKLAESFDADIRVAHRGEDVCGRSIMGLMMLAAGPGSVIEITVSGLAPEPAFEALCALVEDGFHET